MVTQLMVVLLTTRTFAWALGCRLLQPQPDSATGGGTPSAAIRSSSQSPLPTQHGGEAQRASQRAQA
eukprot:2168840-Prorocentrum_lima.AAC.1